MGNFFQVPVNFLAVFVCGIVSMIVGSLWYGPVFGKKWEMLVGLTKEKKEFARKSMAKNYLLMFLSSLVTAYALFHFIWYAAPGSLSLFVSVKTALWGFIGLVFPVSFTKFLFSADKKSADLLFIETGYYLVTLILMSVVFFMFK